MSNDSTTSAIAALAERIMSGNASATTLHELIVSLDDDIATLKENEPARYLQLLEAIDECLDTLDLYANENTPTSMNT